MTLQSKKNRKGAQVMTGFTITLENEILKELIRGNSEAAVHELLESVIAPHLMGRSLNKRELRSMTRQMLADIWE